MSRRQPHNPDAERAVLGSILLSATAFYRVAGIVVADDFYDDANRLIYGVICELASSSRAIDTLTVKDELGRRGQLAGIGGVAYVASLTDQVPDIANVERYAAIVKENARLRALAAVGSDTMRAALERGSTSKDVARTAGAALLSLLEGGGTGPEPARSIVRSTMKTIEMRHQSGREIVGYDTGNSDLNYYTAGWQPDNLVLIAARPAMGKTTFCLELLSAFTMPERGEAHPAGMFSLEMPKEQLMLKLLSRGSCVTGDKLTRSIRYLSSRDFAALADAAARIARAPLFIDDTAALEMLDLRARAMRLQAEHDIKLIVVDYLQLMRARGKFASREAEVGSLSRALKALSKEMSIPVIALAQLSREPDKRADHRPVLADLRESGSLEQDADIVIFLYRDEVYDKESPDRGMAEVIVAKNRNGPIGDFKLAFLGHISRFAPHAPDPIPEQMEDAA
jgi:replicative DNA helicase